MQERGYLPKDSWQERGEEEDKVLSSPVKSLIRKKGFREISVTDIMPSIKARLTDVQITAIMPKNSKGFIAFSKQFSHFVIHPIFLSYIEVSDYLELRKGSVYLWNWYDYHILEELIKMDNLDNYLRINLWLSVTPYDQNQRKYREMIQEIEKENSRKFSNCRKEEEKELYEIQEWLNLDSVFDNVYTKVLEKSESLDYLVDKIKTNVRKIKCEREGNSLYESGDFEVLTNLALSYSFLFPDNSNEKLEFLDALFQGSRDEEVAFWISLWISEKQKDIRQSEIRRRTDIKTLELLIEKYCPYLYKIMNDTKQTYNVCRSMIENFGWKYFPYPKSLSIIDSFLVSGLKGLYERVIIIFKSKYFTLSK